MIIKKRTSSTGANDLQTIYRPCMVDEFIGHESNKKVIKGGLESGNLPHSHLFSGPPGCGKTTMARIIGLGINCDEADGITAYPCLECTSCKSILNYNSMDTQEINVGAYGNKGDVVKIIEDLPSAPFMSRHKVTIFDEAHKLTGPAQDALLKTIEDGYSHVYFIFCTDEPEKLDPAFVERCESMHFGHISLGLIYELLENVAQFEGMEYNKDVLKYLADESRGVPRRSLVWLNSVNMSESWTVEEAKEITGVILDEDSPEVIELCRSLSKCQWKESVKLYSKIKKIPPEKVRLAVEGYFTACLKRAGTYGKGREFSEILDAISQPIYQTGKAGENKMYNYMFKVIDTLKKGA